MDDQFPVPDSVRVLSASFIKSNIPMIRAIGLMETAFRDLSSKTAFIPQRVVMTSPDESLAIFFKPAFMNRYNRMSIKVLTQLLGNQNPDIPTIKGLVLLIDMVSGNILSISDGTSITALRTGAASGIATSYLANPDSSSVAVFGCGAQGKTQLEAILAIRPIKNVFLFDPSLNQAINLEKELNLQATFHCEINPDPGVLKNVDIICTATPSRRPLFSLGQVKPGVHINAIGSFRPDMQEIDPEILRMGLVYVDDLPVCLKESGDLVIPMNAGILQKEDIAGELGELIAGTINGRRNPNEITIFKTVGNAVQDFFIANEAYERSIGNGASQLINLNE